MVPGPASSLLSHLSVCLFLSLLLCPPAYSLSPSIFPIHSYVRVSVTVAYNPKILIDVRETSLALLLITFMLKDKLTSLSFIVLISKMGLIIQPIT